MDQEPDVIRDQIDETRASLTEKIETLETTVKSTIQDARETVEGTVATVKETVEGTIENVKGTIADVKESVSDTVESVKQTFDLGYQTQQRPWLMMGCSFAAGFVVGNLVEGRRHHHGAWNLEGGGYYPERPSQPMTRFRSEEPTTTAHDGRSQASTSTGGGWFGQLLNQFQPELDRLKGMAIGAALAVARDVAKQSLPLFASQIDELTSSVTTKLGGEPIRQPVFQRSGSNF